MRDDGKNGGNHGGNHGANHGGARRHGGPGAPPPAGTPAGCRVRDVEYDSTRSEYRGTLVTTDARGMSLARVAAAGPPGWGHARACAALAAAGRGQMPGFPAASGRA